MQLFVNNWASSLTLPATASAVQLSVNEGDAALLVGLGAGDHYLLTLAAVDVNGSETAWEVVRATGKTAGALDVLRGQEGTAPLDLEAGTSISARLTQETMEALRDSGGGGASAWGAITGTLANQTDLQAALNAKASSAQGALADSAVQPGDLAAVATSGSYVDLASKPAIPTTAAEVGAIAATEKGAASGVATLDAGAKIPLAQLPATAITDTSVVASEAAMLALTAQTGDVAIRTDISTSFILKAEPASTLGNWQEILAPAAGGGAPVGSDVPQALGSASPGVSGSASRQDHVHAMPGAADVGAAPVDHVGTGGAAHADVVAGGASGFMTGAQATKVAGIATGANNYAHPNHSGDVTSTGDGATVIVNDAVTNAKLADMATARLKGRSTAGAGDPEDLTATQARALLNVADGATANSPNATLLDRANHAGTQATSTVTGLDAALSGKQASLVSGTNLKTVNGSSLLGSGDLVVSGGASLPAVQTFAGNKTLALADINKYSVSQDATAQVVTLPAQATVPWTADAESHLQQGAAGGVTITAAAGVSINGVVAGSFSLAGQYAAATLKRTGPDAWTLIGMLPGALTTALNEAAPVTLASAATVDIGAAKANTVNISGTTTITSLGTIAAGAVRRLVFQGVLTLTHNATSLILPTGASITVAAGDAVEFVSLGAGSWRCHRYQRADGTAPALGPASSPTFAALNLSNGQIAFPATQVPSSNANTLDDYEEGVWTPILTFSTPGDLNVVYSTQNGFYTKIGRAVTWTVVLITTTFTHSTAAGQFKITGLPFASTSNPAATFSRWTGVTSGVSTPQVNALLNASDINFEVMNISAGTTSAMTPANASSGVQKQVFSSGTYHV